MGKLSLHAAISKGFGFNFLEESWSV